MVIYALNFSFKMQFLRVSRRKNRIFLPAGPFFLLLYMIAYQSTLISRKLPCPQNFPGYAPDIILFYLIIQYLIPIIFISFICPLFFWKFYCQCNCCCLFLSLCGKGFKISFVIFEDLGQCFSSLDRSLLISSAFLVLVY